MTTGGNTMKKFFALLIAAMLLMTGTALAAKLDLSFVPMMLTGFALGPVAGLCVLLVTNIIHLFYGGDLKKCIAHMEFSDDTADMSEEMLFDKHMRILKKLHSDSLIIIDNFNVLPKEDAFFKEFVKLNCKILVTSRCNISQYETIKISEMDADTELVELFYKHCPSAKSSEDVVKEINYGYSSEKHQEGFRRLSHQKDYG